MQTLQSWAIKRCLKQQRADCLELCNLQRLTQAAVCRRTCGCVAPIACSSMLGIQLSVICLRCKPACQLALASVECSSGIISSQRCSGQRRLGTCLPTKPRVAVKGELDHVCRDYNPAAAHLVAGESIAQCLRLESPRDLREGLNTGVFALGDLRRT